MPDCDYCGANDGLTRTCKYCRRSYCGEHTLPENHDCPGLDRTTTLGPEFRQEGTDSPADPSSTTTIGETKAEHDGAQSTDSRSPTYSKGPDVARDGSIAGRTTEETIENSGILGGIRTVTAGAFAGKRYKGDCPNCGNWVTKRGTQRFTACDDCGWKAGLPGLRIVTHWPNRYLWRRRTARWGKRAVLGSIVIVLLLLLIGATTGTGIAPIDNTAGDLASSAGVAGVVNSSAPASSDLNPASSGGMAESQPGVNRTEVEYQIHRQVNRERASQGLSELEFNDQIREAARYHSKDMATEGYFAHESPAGHTFEDRYEQFGIDCSVRVSSNTRSGGGENIAYTYAAADIEAESGAIINHDGNETKIARGIVAQWMNSSGHRENILQSYWNTEGIGVAVAEGEEGEARVYATQNFC